MNKHFSGTALIIFIATLIFSAGGIYFIIMSTTGRLDKMEPLVTYHDKTIAVISTNIENIQKSIANIERKLDR